MRAVQDAGTISFENHIGYSWVLTNIVHQDETESRPIAEMQRRTFLRNGLHGVGNEEELSLADF